jgi:hypothetical protein
MPNRRFHAILHSSTNLPEDDAVNVLYFDVQDSNFSVGFTSSNQQVCDGIQAAYAWIGGQLGTSLNGKMTVKVYELLGGQPVFEKKYDTPFARGTGACPREVAICLSYATVDNPDASTPRRRGRIYVGPLAGATTETVESGKRQAILDLGTKLSQIGTANGVTWKMFSKMDNAAFKIESMWVDDAYDTQRRRGRKPTTRTTADVQ